MSRVHKILSLAFITFFLGTMFFSLFHMSMGMGVSMTDCPFMAHEESFCPMNLADHIGVWKSIFLSTVPSLILLLVVTGVAMILDSVAPNLLHKILYTSPPVLGWLVFRTYTFSYRPLQDLFSNGILHTKVF